MRVLWLSPTPSMYDEKCYGGWVASLELVFAKHLKNVDLGIAFEYPHGKGVGIKKNNVVYYPFDKNETISEILSDKFGRNLNLDKYLLSIKRIIADFNPDIIQCFGSEYPYGLITKYVKVPVVIHMQGFLNVYNIAELMAYDVHDRFTYKRLSLKSVYHSAFDRKLLDRSSKIEREVMKCNHYFMGRTEWDKSIVKYYSPGSTYYYCSEALRPTIYNSDIHWKWNNDQKPVLITITQAGYLKGNEMILRTADLLKNQFHFNFVWKVAGRKDSFQKFEKKTGIRHEDVNIKLLGMIPSDQVVKELAEARMYIHPAIIDNSPNSLCEAQIIGCPVIAAYVGGIPDLVEDGKTGFLYPYNEPHTLAFKIMDLIDNKNTLSKVSENERMISLERHNPQNIAKCILKIYTKILNK